MNREIELHDSNDDVILVRFDYQPGERTWFNALLGIGHPGSEDMLEITEVKRAGCDWMPPAQCLSERDIEILEGLVLEAIWQDEAEAQAGRPDYKE